MPVVSGMTVPLDVPRAASLLGHDTVNGVKRGDCESTVGGGAERCQPRWHTVRRSRCQNKFPVGNVFATAGTRLPLRWNAYCRFRCQDKRPVGERTAIPVAETQSSDGHHCRAFKHAFCGWKRGESDRYGFASTLSGSVKSAASSSAYRGLVMEREKKRIWTGNFRCSNVGKRPPHRVGQQTHGSGERGGTSETPTGACESEVHWSFRVAWPPRMEATT